MRIAFGYTCPTGHKYHHSSQMPLIRPAKTAIELFPASYRPGKQRNENCPNAEKNTLQSPNIPPIPKRCQTTPQHPTATPPNHCQKESIQRSKTGKHPSKPAGQSLTFAQTRAHTTTPQITPSSGPHSIAPFTTVHSKYRADKNNYTHLGKKRSVTLCLQSDKKSPNPASGHTAGSVKTINCPLTISMASPKTAMTSNTVTDIKLNTNTTMQRNKPNLNIGLTLNM